MGNAFLAGMRGALWRWPLVVLLWAIGALFAFAFSLIAGAWLQGALDASLTTRTLLKSLDASALIDLWTYHGESFRQFALTALVLALVQIALSILLHGGIAGTALDVAGAVRLREFWSSGFALYPVFAGLWLMATMLQGAAVALLALVLRLAGRWFAESPSEMTYYYVAGSALVVVALLLVLLVTLHDHARLYAARQRVGPLQAFGWAAWFVTRGDGRALPLALLLLATGVACWAVYQGIADLIGVTTTTGVTMSLLWGQVFLQLRALLRVAAFVAQGQLQEEMPE